MSKKPASQKRAQRQQEERAALNNIFTTFLVGLVAECYLFLVYRSFQKTFILTWYNNMTILMWIGLAIMVCGIGFAIWKKTNEKFRRIGVTTAVSGAFLGGSSLIMTTFPDNGVTTMCAAVPVLTILALIFFLYQRDCFLNTMLLAGALFSLWVCDTGLDGGWKLYITIGAILVVALLAGVGILSRKLQTNEGKLGKRQLLPVDCDYRMIYIISALSIVLIVAALIIPAYIYYMIWVAVIAIFAELAYYTTKMM